MEPVQCFRGFGGASSGVAVGALARCDGRDRRNVLDIARPSGGLLHPNQVAPGAKRGHDRREPELLGRGRRGCAGEVRRVGSSAPCVVSCVRDGRSDGQRLVGWVAGRMSRTTGGR